MSPDDSLHRLQGLPADLSPFLIESPERMDHFIGGHVLGVFVVGHVEKAAFRTKAAMDTMGQKAFHFAFLPIQHLFDFFRFDRSLFLVWHPGLHPMTSCCNLVLWGVCTFGGT